ncbi:hypothetical protein DM01DRAFT_321907 [Hesseltinella vesiculosa]|uniref:EF-hand domain-containing protein n=1 Tax=Hesseltinella vesiculosa TaxID=101127 RepID=A0A1X2GQW0_9FUNG|nr:hypothetical protein DM01DRAFT_321907 [Hesseltinella vesiculosa]
MATDSSEDAFSILLDDTDEFLPAVEKILKEIFAKFDKDNDNVWSTEELQAFAKATNGDSLDSNSLQDIAESFDVDDKNRLTSRGFYEMMHLQTLSDPEETLSDLKKHGYEDQLKK